MANTRLEKILELLKESPDDPFLIYGAALEYQKTDVQTASAYFDRLLNNFEAYLPAYYHAAALFAETGESQKARAAYEKGIRVAEKQQDAHALRELKSAYQNFLLEEDGLL